jgi:hypothetical protein
MQAPTNDVPIPTQRWRHHVGCAAATAVAVALGIWFVGAIKQAREAARSMTCESRLNQLHLAFHNYHDTYGCFPPAYVADAAGKPMHSWRVLILPFIDGGHLYQQYRFDEPWNSPSNQKLANEIGVPFHCINNEHEDSSPLTDYVVIVGDETLFPGPNPTAIGDIRDGPENTILLAEIANSDIHWMEPRDLDADEMSFTINDPVRPSISGPHPNGPAVVFVDRLSAYRIDSSVRPETLRALTTIAGGEPVSKEDLVRWSDRTRWQLAE